MMHPINSSQLSSFSGGQDSTLLLLQSNPKFTKVVHLNHLIQKDNFVFTTNCLKLQYFFKVKYHFATPFLILSNENQSAKWRYEVMARTASYYHYSSFLVGKTYTDYYENWCFSVLKRINYFFFFPQSLKLQYISLFFH